MKKIVFGCALVLLIAISGCSWFFYQLGKDLVVYEVASRHSSPTGEYTSVFYTSDAGATTSTALFGRFQN